MVTALSKSAEKQLQECLDEIDRHKTALAEGVVGIGRALTTAKELMPKGDFKDWVENNCRFARTTAYRYMEAFAAFGKFQKLDHFDDTALYVLSKCEPAAKKAKEMATRGKRITQEIAKELVTEARENTSQNGAVSQNVTRETDPDTPTFTCPNCNGTETDDDGDCAKCHEPAAAVEPDPEPEGGYEPHEARKPLDKLFKSLGDAARSCKDAQKILPNCVHLADCFAAIDTASLALHRSRSSFKRRPK